MCKYFKNIKIIFIVIILSLCIFLIGCSTNKSNQATPSNNQSISDNSNNDNFTLLIYMCGSSLESKNGSATDDISELLSANIPSNANVIIETGGSLSWKKYGIRNDKSQRYKISNNQLELLNESNIKNMGESSTLEEFINWGTKKFPSKRTGLILWDHGGGFLKGICKDEIYNNDWLTVNEFDEALSNSNFNEKFDFIGFDCCLMSNYETSLTVSKYADYMIASEDNEPTGGWDYKSITNLLGKKDFYDVVLNSYEKSHLESENYTLSVINLKRINELKSVLLQCIDKTENNNLSMSKAVETAESFESNITHLYDLGNIADYYNINFDFNKIIKMVSSKDRNNTSGISLCFPANDEDDLKDYLLISKDKNYCNYLKNNYLK